MSTRSTTTFLYLLFSIHFALVRSQGLERFASCKALTDFYKEEALSRVGPNGLPGVFSFFPVQPAQALSGPLLGAQTESQPQAGIDFSDTNVQVEGVDEPDIVKTDGKRVFVVRGNYFYVINVSKDGSAGRKSGLLKLPTYSTEMLIQGDNVLVLGVHYDKLEPKKKSSGASFGGNFLSLLFSQQVTTVYRISVKGSKPKLLASLRMEGKYVSAREVDGVARIVTTSTPATQIKFTFPSGKKVTKKQAQQINKEIIRNTTTGSWLSRYVLEEKDKKTVRGFISPCTSVYKSNGDFTGFNLLTVTTLTLSGPLLPDNSVSIGSEGDDVYSTASNLYVATTKWQYDSSDKESSSSFFKTSLHKFALSNKGQKYIASGEVTGSLLNQFSMHEFKGMFYAATTEGAPWWTRRDTSVSKVTAFKTNTGSGKLVETGNVGNLGVGERIFAVRYIESTAYVVTFRQIDPLYIIDLSKLKATGELKIPGFSSYLHPIAPGRILGVGGDATKRGRVTGAKVSLFDVSDVTELSTWTLKGGSSRVEWDHRAFLYWEPESIAVLPVSAYGKNRFIGSVVLNISNTEITERGRIVHPKCCGRFASRPTILRNFVIEREYLWSLSRSDLQVNNIMSLKKKSGLRLRK